jgi:hypothetical protein
MATELPIEFLHSEKPTLKLQQTHFANLLQISQQNAAGAAFWTNALADQKLSGHQPKMATKNISGVSILASHLRPLL